MPKPSLIEIHALGERPGGPGILLSLAIHAAAAILIVAVAGSRPQRSVYTPVTEAEMTKGSPGGVIYLSARSTAMDGLTFKREVARNSRARAASHEVRGTPEGKALQELRTQASQRTAAITNTLRIRGIYGFAPGADYRLAIQTAGEVPKISAAEVPPRYEQLVQIEVTIDTQGRVADARIIAGLVDQKIEQKLLAAVREFKYIPATRDGSPIPSQRDIVIHIPS